MFNVSICLVDHYDSYTYNLHDMIASRCLVPPIVIAKDSNVSDLSSQTQVDGYVLSPGPGRPPRDTGISLELIENNPSIPIFGVCLGHQALGYAYGANVTEAPTPIHGQLSKVHFDSSHSMWNNVTNPLQVVRYHSLIVQDWNVDTVPLQATAWCDDTTNDTSIVMALQHRQFPHFGLQFHPESIGTLQGTKMVENFLQVCQEYKQQQEQRREEEHENGQMTMTTKNKVNGAMTSAHVNGADRAANGRARTNGMEPETQKKKRKLQLHIRRVGTDTCPSQVFSVLHGNHSYAAWLDSSNAQQQQDQDSTTTTTTSRFSIMAAMDGPLSRRIDYCVDTQTVNEYDAHGHHLQYTDVDILSFLRQDLESIHLDDDTYDDDDLPFEYRGGYLGFLGYEVGQDTQRALQQLEGGQLKPSLGQASSQNNKTPSAAFLFADQSLVYDHWEQEWYLLGLASNNDDALSSVWEWMDRVEQVLLDLQSPEVTIEATNDVETCHRPYRHRPPLAFVPNRSPQRYRSNIATCHEEIRLGESYELCLTNQLEATVSQVAHSPLQLYKVLRQRNPVPFAAFINFQQGAAPVSVCCSSPERFVSVKKHSPDSPHHSNDDTKRQQDGDSWYVEAKPIKGTCARQVVTDRPRTVMEKQEDARRAHELETCVKNRAENLMIVDLLRNDLNRVCRVGSVHVPKLMHIESYTTVHQMVSTIRGILSQDKNAIDVLQACFPGGSMTGAPKLRSMEILNELEEGVPRGPYSGCLGYISLNGSMDMNIVIRSAVLTPENNDWHVRIGAGGAITALSESEDEYEEMLLKARAVVEAVQAWSDAIPEVLEKEEAPTVPIATNNMTLSAANTV